MENFSTLTASVSGGNISLAWTLPGDAALATSVAVQRSPFGEEAFVTVSTQAPTILTYGDGFQSLAQGSYSYRVLVTVTQPDGKTYVLSSNQVDVTTESTTGECTLTGTATTPSNQDISGPTGFKLISLSWVFSGTDPEDSTVSFEVQRSLDAGVTWRADVNTTQLSHSEELPAGTGSVQYRVIASIPNVGTGDQLNRPVQSTSNVVTLSV